MADRRSFLGAVSGVAASVLLAPPADAQAPAPVAAPASSPPPSPAPSAAAKPPSALGAAIAATMTRFDPKLSDKDLDAIARGIDDNRRGAAKLNPNKARDLKNADEPVVHFSVGRRSR